MSRTSQTNKIQPHWWSKTLAGVILGLTLCYGLVGLFAWFGPGGIDAPAKVQLNMWLITPLWLTLLSLVYLFPTGRRAWGWLAAANGLVYLVYIGLRIWA